MSDPVPQLRILSDGWRERLRAAVARTGRKRSAIAWEAGIAPESLSRILNGRHQKPAFQTVARIAAAVKIPLGWIAGEPAHTFLSDKDAATLRDLIQFLAELDARLEPTAERPK